MYFKRYARRTIPINQAREILNDIKEYLISIGVPSDEISIRFHPTRMIKWPMKYGGP